MAAQLEGLPPVHYHGQNKVWNANGEQYIAVNLGTAQDPQYVWRKVLYRWIGNNNRWFLAYRNDGQSSVCHLENARYFEGASYRGDVALFGTGLQELPDATRFFTGSLYKFYSNGSDLLENYVNFGRNGEEPLFGIDGVYRMAKLRAAKQQYFNSVTAVGQEGYNWGVGAFVGTIPTAIYPNTWSLQFRLQGFPAGQTRMWLLYGGSKVTYNNVQHTMAFGAFVTNDNKLVYFRRFDDQTVHCEITLTGTGWQQVQVQQAANHDVTVSVNVGTANAASVSCPRLVLYGKQFDDVLLGCGPSIPDGQLLPTGDVYDRTMFTNMDMRRFYVDTRAALDVSVAPRYWEQPSIRLEMQYAGTQDWVDISKYLVNWPHEQDNRRLVYTLPPAPNGSHRVRFISNYGTSTHLPVRIDNELSRKTELFTDFTDLNEMRLNWMVAHKQWGGTASQGQELLNGGVVRDNIEVYPEHVNPSKNVNGVLRLRGHGSFYDGPVIGVNRLGQPAPDGRKTEVGSCIVSKDYLGAGSYRARVRSPYRKGACTAFWTFHYEEIYENDERWNDFLTDGDEGLRPQGNSDDGFYIVRNQEIDIEYPTALKNAPDMEQVSYQNARMNTWQGEMRNYDVPEGDPAYWSEYTDFFEPWAAAELNDGEWHEIRFDWHTADPNPPAGKPARRVDFYLDGVLKWTNTTHIPDIPGRLWLGVWYPRATGNRWAGYAADYVYDSLDVDWIRFTPFNEPVREVGETYPADVWRDWVWENFKQGYLSELPPPYQLGTPYADDIPKTAEGFWQPSAFTLAGANPPQFIGPHRLEWRNDRKAFGTGAGECLFVGLTAGTRYRMTIDVKKTRTQSGGLELVTFESGVTPHRILGFEGVEQYVFTAQSQGRVALRRRVGSGGNLYEGLTDIKLEVV